MVFTTTSSTTPAPRTVGPKARPHNSLGQAKRRPRFGVGSVSALKGRRMGTGSGVSVELSALRLLVGLGDLGLRPRLLCDAPLALKGSRIHIYRNSDSAIIHTQP